MLLTNNRNRPDVIFLCSEPEKLVTLFGLEFSIVPILPWSGEENDIQLNIVENYLLKARLNKKMCQKLKDNFNELAYKSEIFLSFTNKI